MTIRQLLYLGTALIAVGQPAFAQTAVPADATAAEAAAPAAPAPSGEANAAAAATKVAPEPDPQSEAQAAALAASPDAPLRTAASEVFKVIPRAAEPPHGATMTRAKIDLGSMLFFDPRMSKSGVFSCQSCHNIGMGGVDGRAPDLAAQAQGPVQAGVEMNNTPEHLIQTVKSMPGYVDAFTASFPGEADPITFDNFAHAIEAFEATLLTPNARFDQWLQGVDGAMNEQEKRGLQAFMDTGCMTCHAGTNFGGEGYYPFGLVEAPDASVRPERDMGRFKVTNTTDDEYVFRAAPLRNVAITAPYFHSGKVWNLEDAVRIMSNAQLGTELTAEQAQDIVAFLGTLTGEQPQIVHPTLPVRMADTPKPAPIDLPTQGNAAAPQGADAAAPAADAGGPADAAPANAAPADTAAPAAPASN